jgi:hypothetical protein
MYISNRDINGMPYNINSPFNSKALDIGSLHRKVYGQTINLIPNDICYLNFVIEQNKIKINKVDLVWFPEGCTCDFKIYE